MGITEQFNKEAGGVIGQLILRSQKKTNVLHSVLFSLEKVLHADKIGAQQNFGAFEIVQVHMQVAENLIHTNSDYFSIKWLKLFAHIKTQWDKEMLRGTWNEYIKIQKYKSDIDKLCSFFNYIQNKIYSFQIKNKLLILILVIILILIELIIF